ncbi:MAG: hypothetical protein RTV72_11755 [Candidatus Thorarchaeota archaeon]
MTNDSSETVRPYLLPNEDIEFIRRIQSGFIVLSSRRFVLLKEEERDAYCIEKAIPHSCISSIEQKKIDRFEISSIALDQNGHHTSEVRSFNVNAPRGEHGENKEEIQNQFQSAMNRCFSIIEEKRNLDQFAGDTSSQRDYSYLEHLPESLTRNAILDLNTILQDQPVPDELVHEAEKFLGAEPFIIEESLRNGNDKEDGILFAVGKRGYYWIKGKKTGRFMTNVIIDTVEWDNIRSFSFQWEYENAVIDVTYSLTSDGKESTTQYQWSPPVNDETLQYPWLLQHMNGSWILADIICKYSEVTFPNPSILGLGLFHL